MAGYRSARSPSIRPTERINPDSCPLTRRLSDRIGVGPTSTSAESRFNQNTSFVRSDPEGSDNEIGRPSIRDPRRGMGSCSCCFVGFVVPRAEAIFQDFGVPLPRITDQVFAASHMHWAWLSRGPDLACGGLVRAWTPARMRTRPGHLRIGSTLLLVLPLVLIGIVLLALALPCFTVMTRLSG